MVNNLSHENQMSTGKNMKTKQTDEEEESS